MFEAYRPDRRRTRRVSRKNRSRRCVYLSRLSLCLSLSLLLALTSVWCLASSCLKNSSGPLTAKDLPLFSPLHEPKLLICSKSVLPVSICLSVYGSLPFFLAICLSFSASLSLSLSLSPRVCPKTVQCKPPNANKSSRKRGTSYARTVTRNFARNLPDTHKFYFTPQKLFITYFFLSLITAQDND